MQRLPTPYTRATIPPYLLGVGYVKAKSCRLGSSFRNTKNAREVALTGKISTGDGFNHQPALILPSAPMVSNSMKLGKLKTKFVIFIRRG